MEKRNNPKPKSLWTPSDPRERAVVRGVVKAYFIIAFSQVFAALVIWCAYAAITNYINP